MIEKYDAREKHIVISIRNPKSDKAKLSEVCKDFRVDSLFIAVDDCDVKGRKGVIFTMEMAKQVWEIVDRYEKDVDLIVINCEAGISRSSAVGAALSKVLNNDDNEFFRYFYPNMYIYNKVISIKQ